MRGVAGGLATLETGLAVIDNINCVQERVRVTLLHGVDEVDGAGGARDQLGAAGVRGYEGVRLVNATDSDVAQQAIDDVLLIEGHRTGVGYGDGVVSGVSDFGDDVSGLLDIDGTQLEGLRRREVLQLGGDGLRGSGRGHEGADAGRPDDLADVDAELREGVRRQSVGWGRLLAGEVGPGPAIDVSSVVEPADRVRSVAAPACDLSLQNEPAAVPCEDAQQAQGATPHEVHGNQKVARRLLADKLAGRAIVRERRRSAVVTAGR